MMKSHSKTERLISLMGVGLVMIGLVANEWVLKKLFSPDGVLEPSTRITILVFEATCILFGMLAIRFSPLVDKGILSLSCSVGSVLRTRKRELLVSLLVFIISLFVVGELVFRVTGRYKTYCEKNGFSYCSPYRRITRTPWLLILPPNKTTTYQRPEYDFELRTNSEGLRDTEHPLDKPEGEFRIVGLGDSFTEGLGAGLEDTYLSVLEKSLSSQSAEKAIRVISGGVSGSDPVFSYYLLEKRLLKYRPDIVLLLINASDINDFIVRGGMDRFGPDGRMRKNPRPKLEWFFARSHFVRAILLDLLDYDYLLLRTSERIEKEHSAVSQIIETVDAFQRLGREEGFCLYVAVHPHAHEVTDPTETNPFQRLLDVCRQRDLNCVDLYETFRLVVSTEELWEYFWPIDYHYTPQGYHLVAKGIENRLREDATKYDFPWDGNIPVSTENASYSHDRMQ